MHIFLFQDNNLRKSQRIFTQFDMCIDIVKIWFGIVIGYISSIFDRVICRWHDNGGVLSFQVLILLNQKANVSKLHWKYWGDLQIKSSKNRPDWKSKMAAIAAIVMSILNFS